MYGKLVFILCASAVVSAGYSGPPHYGYDQSVSSKSDSYKSVSQVGTFGPIASNSDFKGYSGPTISPIPTPVPGAFTATTKNGIQVSEPSYPAIQYSKTKTKSVSLSYNNPSVAYPTQYSGVTDYPASYSSQNYAQVPQGYSQAYPQPQAYQLVQVIPQGYSQAAPQAVPQGIPQAVPQGIPQAIPQGIPQAVPQGISQAIPQGLSQAAPQYQYQGQVAVPGYQSYSSQSHQIYSAPSHQVYSTPSQQTYQAPTQYKVYQPAQYQAPQYQAYSVPVQYSGYSSGYPSVQYSSPVQYSAPVQYSSAPAVSHVQYSGNDGSYSWKRK